MVIMDRHTVTVKIDGPVIKIEGRVVGEIQIPQ